MYWALAKMLLLADVGEYSFANAALAMLLQQSWAKPSMLSFPTELDIILQG